MSKSILILEEDADLVQAMVSFLEQQSYRVVVATSVREAILKIRNQRFFCLITDIRAASSGENRLDILCRSKEVDQDLNVPILVISASLNPDVLSRIAPHVHGALLKPFSMDALLGKIMHCEPSA